LGESWQSQKGIDLHQHRKKPNKIKGFLPYLSDAVPQIIVPKKAKVE